MEAEVEGPQQRKDVHQDEQNHGRHDECHLQLVIAHPARHFMYGVGLHIFLESQENNLKTRRWNRGEGWKGYSPIFHPCDLYSS